MWCVALGDRLKGAVVGEAVRDAVLDGVEDLAGVGSPVTGAEVVALDVSPGGGDRASRVAV